MTPNTCPAFHTNLRNCDRVALRASREIDGIDVDAEAEEVHSSIVDRTTDADPGRIRLSFDDGRVVLEVLLGDARTRLDDWYARHGPLRADSVFLDGFDPRKNPVIWSETTLRSVAAHCRSGTRIATWSVARPVRDALQAAGFQVHKRPGLPPKRDCLAGRFIGGSAVAGAPTLRSGPPPRYRS
ncbi:MAG: MnmC family methyltransferase [Lautropia sp.]|nr:MnmC family methyltransferase [Lautropia sp.]